MICYLLVIFCIVEFSKKHYVSSLMIFFFLLLEGFQVVPLKFLTWGFFSGTTVDAALLALLGLLVIRGKIWFRDPLRNTPVAKAILFFMYYVILNMLFGLIIERYALVDVFRGARLYFFLLVFFMYTEVPLKDIIKIIRIIIFIVFIQSVLYLLQVYTKHAILQAGDTTQYMDDLDYTRFLNTPRLLSFAMAICFFWFPFKSFLRKYKIVFITVLVLAFLGPLPRAGIICWFVSVTLYSLFFEGHFKRAIYLFGAALAAFVLSYIDIVQKRFASVVSQLSIVNDLFQNKMLEGDKGFAAANDNTFLFRLNHLIERVTYINTHSFGWLFGIGFLDEKAPQAESLPFRYGIINPLTGHPFKIFTVDIVWSMTILTMGYIGTIIFLNIYSKILINYSRTKTTLPVSKVIFVLVVLGILVSFTSNSLLDPGGFIFVLMLVVLIEKKKQQDVLMMGNNI